MKSIRCTFLFRALFALALLLWVAGCSTGNGDGDGAFFGGEGAVSQANSTGTVVINQQFLSRALPAEVARERFLGFNASDVLVYGPVTKDRACSNAATRPGTTHAGGRGRSGSAMSWVSGSDEVLRGVS